MPSHNSLVYRSRNIFAHPVYFLSRGIFGMMMLYFGLSQALMAQPFEGEIELKISTKERQGKMNLLISPKGFRANFSGPNPFSLVLPKDSLEAYRLNPKTKRYMTFDYLEQKRLSTALGGLESFNVHHLQPEKRLGLLCLHAELKSNLRSIQVWIAPSLIDSIALRKLFDAGALIGLSAGALETIQKEGLYGFPMKVLSLEGSQPIEMEVVSLQRKKINAKQLVIPTSYLSESD